MTMKPDEMIAELERELTEARERLREQHEAHARAQEQYPSDAFEAGTRTAGERVRVARAKLEAAQRMREACAGAAIEHVMPEGSRVEVMLPGKVDAAKVTVCVTPDRYPAKVTIGGVNGVALPVLRTRDEVDAAEMSDEMKAAAGALCEHAEPVHGVGGVKGVAVPVGDRCAVEQFWNPSTADVPEDERKVRAEAQRLFHAFVSVRGRPLRWEDIGSWERGAWAGAARASLRGTVAAAEQAARAEREACAQVIVHEIVNLPKIGRLSAEQRDTAREFLTYALNAIHARGATS